MCNNETTPLRPDSFSANSEGERVSDKRDYSAMGMIINNCLGHTNGGPINIRYPPCHFVKPAKDVAGYFKASFMKVIHIVCNL